MFSRFLFVFVEFAGLLNLVDLPWFCIAAWNHFQICVVTWFEGFCWYKDGLCAMLPYSSARACQNLGNFFIIYLTIVTEKSHSKCLCMRSSMSDIWHRWLLEQVLFFPDIEIPLEELTGHYSCTVVPFRNFSMVTISTKLFRKSYMFLGFYWISKLGHARLVPSPAHPTKVEFWFGSNFDKQGLNCKFLSLWGWI